jgi:hypothetical protein
MKENQRAVADALVLDVLFLLSSYLLLLVASGSIKLAESQKLDVPMTHDESDFITEGDGLRANQSLSGSFHRFTQAAAYGYFPYFLIIYLLCASATLNGHMVSDLLSSIYLWFALVFIVRMRKFFADHVKVLRPLRAYNRIVLSLVMLYQAPLFLCPTSIDINGYSDPDYVTTEDCALIMHRQALTPSDWSSRKEAKSTTMQLYIILMHSLGLLKENAVNTTFLFIFWAVEVQHQLFLSPYYREYVVKHTTIEKESVGKLRAFMFTERFHLCRQWAYTAIKEEIQIYHKILVRLNEKVLSSDFIKTLDAFRETSAGKDAEEEHLLDQKDEAQKPADVFEDKLTPLIDRITLESLRDDQPTVPLDMVVGELKLSLATEFGEDKELKDLTVDELRERVQAVVKGKLEDQVYAKNRLDLYHREGLGLGVALNGDHRVGANQVEAESGNDHVPYDAQALSESRRSNEQLMAACQAAAE